MISGRLHTSRLLPRLPLALLLLAFFQAGTAPWALAVQGSAEDYERAAGLRERFEGLLLRHDAEPRWLDGQRLWYTVTVAPDQREVVVVDAALPAAERRLVLAAEDALAGAAGLPGARVRRLAWDGGQRVQLLLGGGEAGGLFEWDRSTEELTELDPRSSELFRQGGSGRGAGREVRTGMLLVNGTGAPLELFYLPGRGERRSYGTLEPGVSRWQGTFAGHRWVAVDDAGQEVVRFTAEREAGIVVLGAEAAASGEPRPAGEEPGGEEQPNKVAPSHSIQAFVRDHDLWLRLEDGSELRLTEDGEEGDAYKGPLRWNAARTHLLCVKTRRGLERTVHIVESSPEDQLQPRLQSFSYRKPGDAVEHRRPRLFAVEPDGTATAVPIDEALFPNPYSISRLGWEEDGSRFTFLYNQRGHQVLRFLSVDAATGAVTAIVDESSPTFVDYSQKTILERLPGGELLWASERDGWNHLYLVDDSTGEVKRQVTAGEWVVRSLESVDPAARTAIVRVMGFINGEDPYHEHFLRVSLDGGEPVRLTTADGTHEIELSPDGSHYVDRYSRVDRAPVVELRRTADAGYLGELERADISALVEAGWRPPRRYIAGGRDGMTEIWGIAYYPSQHDPSLREAYPIVESIYAGPHGAHVPKEFRVHRKQAELAELGFVVVQVDGMGTNWRSKAFHDVCWQDLGDAGFPDRVAWIRSLAGEDSSLDSNRVGIYGGSAGGQNAMRALISHGDFYMAAVADCGCHDNRMDKIWWNEAWMGWPVGEQYAASSNVDQAHRLQGDLLLIVGELDRNVDPASTMQVVDALIRADKDFELLVVPGGGHGVAESAYGTRRRRDFLVRKLHGLSPRWR